MLTITEEMREAARKLLKAAELPAGAYNYVSDLAKRKQLQAVGKLNRTDRDLLTAIANGTRKRIDGRWWKEIHHYVVNQPRLDKLSRLADPARNDNPHERDLARARLAGFKAKRPPGLPPEGRPLPKSPEEWAEAKRQATEARKRQRKAVVGATDSVATKPATNSVAARPRLTTDSVAKGWRARRTAAREQTRAGLRC